MARPDTRKAGNGQTFHEVVEEYASDNDAFIRDFSAVFQKMMENGYQPGNALGNPQLQDSSWDWVNMRCNTNKCLIKFP